MIVNEFILTYFVFIYRQLRARRTLSLLQKSGIAVSLYSNSALLFLTVDLLHIYIPAVMREIKLSC